MQESPQKALAVLLAVALICSVLVSVSAVVLRPIQEANERIERYRHIVALTGLTTLRAGDLGPQGSDAGRLGISHAGL